MVGGVRGEYLAGARSDIAPAAHRPPRQSSESDLGSVRRGLYAATRRRRSVRGVPLPPPGGSDRSSQQRPCLPIDFLGGDQLDFAGIDLRCPLTGLLEPQAVELFR